MSDRLTRIEDLLRDILEAHYGRDVRQAIHDILAWANTEITRISAEWVAYQETMNAWKDALEAEWDAWKDALEAEWDATKDDLYSIIDHLCYVNEKTGDVVLTGEDIYLDYGNPESKTIAECMRGTASDIMTSLISGSEEDYRIVVTTGGLV